MGLKASGSHNLADVRPIHGHPSCTLGVRLKQNAQDERENSQSGGRTGSQGEP